MAGCFGNHPFDRAMEAELNRYLDSTEPMECEVCGEEMDWDGMRERWECPACGAIQYDNDDGKYDGDYHREDD